MAAWGVGGVTEILARCALCDETLVGLRHLLQDCKATATYRAELPPVAQRGVMLWALAGDSDVDGLRKRVRFVGICLAELAYGMADSGGNKRGEMQQADRREGSRDGPQGRAARRPRTAWEARLGGDAPSVARRKL